jgi:hypothetical protein
METIMSETNQAPTIFNDFFNQMLQSQKSMMEQGNLFTTYNPYASMFPDLFKSNKFVKKMEDLKKITEDASKKTQQLFKEQTDSFVEAEQLKSVFSELLNPKDFQNHLNQMNHTQMLYADQFKKITKVSQDSKEKTEAYLKEQKNYMEKLQSDVTTGLSKKDAIKEIVSAVKNYSKSVVTATTNVIDKSAPKF